MAAMAPALTDAPAEAHHIRFKLAAPSSSLSPGGGGSGGENRADSTDILVRGSPKRKAAPEDTEAQQEQQRSPQGDSLGKLQPLVASYLCSDVTPVPPGKESITLQGVLLKQSVLKSHRILPGSLLNGGGGHAAQLSPGRLKRPAGGGGGRPVNGLAKNPPPAAAVSVNGDEPPAEGSPGALSDRRPPSTAAAATTTVTTGAATSPAPSPASPSRQDPERPGVPPSRASPWETRAAERARLNGCRQAEIEGRLRRLRKRLQVVQAKQVERHVQQQLGGFLDVAAGRLSAGGRRERERERPSGPWRRQPAGERDALARFLKSGSVPLELERLCLSGSANLRSAERAFDSDVTESSSGGDSDLEEDQLSRADVDRRHVKIWKRAESRYTLERAAIISHWNWLQAHISDLEYRIRQQTDIFRQIRASKGSLELGGLAPREAKTEQADAQDAGPEHAGAAEPWKGQNGQPLNGVLGRATESADGAAARTRPLLGWRRRRLVRPDAVADLRGKAVRRSGGACGINPACVMCGGHPVPREDPRFQLPVLERLSGLDPGVHPILSFPDDVGVGLRVQQAMKTCWSGRSPERSKPLKKFSLKRKLSSSKEKHKFTSSLMAVRLSHYKNRADKSGTPEGCKAERLAGAAPPLGPYDRGYGRKRSREHSADGSDASPKFSAESAACPPLPSSSSSGLHSPASRPPLTPSDVPPGTMLQPVRRRRGESSFDINNIVIPMSVAATTRVEKLQYKEIITPSWRAADVAPLPAPDNEECPEVEDLSDAAFVQLHQPYEDQERSRWTWMALAPAKRRGSRSYKSADGRTTPLLCGTNPPTPQPASPEHDYGHLASPVSPPSPDTPCSRDWHRPASSEDTRCSTPDLAFEERTVAPWERRNFPMPEDPAPEPEPRSPPAGRRRDWEDGEPSCCHEDERS
ncbi:KAT8 regulatory NSL complex subunit 1-like [Stigmatopora nigra]